MNARFFTLALAAAGLLTACSTSHPPAQVWEGAPLEVRERLGIVGLRVEYAESREFSSDAPDARGVAAGDAASVGLAANLNGAAHAGKAAPLVLALMPAFVVGGAIYGSVTGVPEAELKRAITAVTNAWRECDLMVQLPERVMDRARADDFTVVDGRGGNVQCHSSLALRIVTQQLARGGIEDANPALFLHYVVEARVIGTNGMLYSTYVEATSRRRDFTEWAEDDARRLRRESKRMAEQIAGKIVDRVFHGNASE